MPFTKGHTLWKHPNCKKSQFKKGESVRVGMKHSEETKRKVSESRRGKCLGKDNPSYKHGATPLINKIKRLPEYTRWRNEVLERDNFTCRKCIKRGGMLHPHHIVAFSHLVQSTGIKKASDAIKCAELWDLENGVTLCEGCHKETPNWSYRARSNPVDTTVYQLTNQR